MTPRGLLHKAQIAKSATAFLAAHREYMLTGELAEVCAPIVSKIDANQVLPTPGLAELVQVIFTHNQASELSKAEAAMVKMQERGSGESDKPYIAKILDAKGNLVNRRIGKDEVSVVLDAEGDLVAQRKKTEGELEPLEKGFDSHERAVEWCERRLFDGAPDWVGQVEAKNLIIQGERMKTKVERSTAFSKILKEGKGAVCKRKPTSTSRLGFGVKASQDTAKFSRG